MDERREHSETVDGQSPSSQPASNLIVLSITAIAVGGIWWWAVGTVQAPWKKPGESSKSITTHKPPGNIATNGNGNGKRNSDEEAVSVSVGVQASPDPEFDSSRTSWQNPFVASHWKSTSWQFSPRAMQSTGTNDAVAVFRRDYRKVTVECEVVPIGEPGEFRIVLYAAETDAMMRAEFTQHSIKLTAKIKGVDSVIKQRKLQVPFDAKTPTTLRLTATGNRALVVCDGKVVFNGSQPAEQSGKPLNLSLSSQGGAFRISDLRLEGE